MSANDIHCLGRARAQRIEDDAIDAVTDLRERRRCHYDRAGMDSVTAAAHLWAETGHVPGWDISDPDDDGGDWAA